MAKFFQKILCPIDFDENSMAALDYACRLAVENDAVLYVLHAIFIPVCGELLIFDTNQQFATHTSSAGPGTVRTSISPAVTTGGSPHARLQQARLTARSASASGT